MNLHDWIDELCDAFDMDAEVDEALVLDLARDAAHNVERPAAPITTYLLGYAAGLQQANPEEVERLAAVATELAEKWEGGKAIDEVVLEDVEEIDEALVDVD